MSEDRAKYNAGGQALKPAENTLRPFTDPEYQAPTFEDVRALKDYSGLTGRELGALVGLDDHRTLRRWTQDPEQKGARAIPYSAWRLLLLELGLAKISREPEKPAKSTGSNFEGSGRKVRIRK